MSAKFDQELAEMRDSLPRAWYAIHKGCMLAGFTPAESFALLETFILSQAPHGINAPHPINPPEKE